MNRFAPLLAVALAACTTGPTDETDTDAPHTDVTDTDVADTDTTCPDADGDGVCDADDLCAGGDDAADADGDGLADACDLCPLDAANDVDLDGACADVDPCPLDPGDDSDEDGVCDGVDVCPNFPDQLDGDGDTVPDACDLCPLDAADDSDADGVCDSDDLCPGADDGADADGDLTPDACDPCPYDSPDDSDGDTVCDSDDTCAGDDLLDSDADGAPDDCDPCPMDSPDDSDSDGVCDSVDVCPGYNDAADADGDTVADGCDPCPQDSPDDSDGDGVCDSNDACPGHDDAQDFDADLLPDACDACPRDPYNDEDGDGICLDQDACPNGDNTPGTNGYAVDCAVCAPFTSVAAFGPTASTSRQFSQVSRLTDAAFGTATRLSSTTSLDLFSPDLQLPPGDWVLYWRVMGTTTPRDLVLSITASGCAYTIPTLWWASDQPADGVWGWSAPLSVHVNGPGLCAVTPELKNTNVAQTKSGYVFDHVRADTLCRTVDDCPTVSGATAACTPEGRCAWSGEDADGDNLCDAIDVCPGGDDRTHDDADGVPAACDCDDADPFTWPGADQICGVDGDCDGLIDPTVTSGSWMHSMTEYHPEWDGRFMFKEPSSASDYGKVYRSDPLLSWVYFDDGPITYLDAGDYLLDYRIAPTRAGITVSMTVDPAANANCVQTAEGSFDTQGATGQFEVSAPLAFTVTRDRCPVVTRLWETNVLHVNWLFDWARIRRACDTAQDCPTLVDGTPGTCEADGACDYTRAIDCPI